jgi:hypothetical protein
MQLNINITKKNKDKIFKLIEAVLEDDEELPLDLNKILIDVDKQKEESKKEDYLQIPPGIEGFRNGKIASYLSEKRKGENRRLSSVGSWGQFNSFFPIKAALRILANYMLDRDVPSVKLNELVKVCVNTFKQRGYDKKRGFPSSNKDTAKGRFVWHFLATAYEMGLIRISYSDLKYDGLPGSLQDWDTVEIGLTKQGMEFALLPNNIFDGISEQQVLTSGEREWMISYLKKIDEDGYKEYNLLKDVYTFLSEGHNGKDDLWKWFSNNNKFVDYIKSWSRKAQRGDEQALNEQIDTLSTSFASSKVALLRELGVILNRRNDYSLIGEL